MGQEVAERGHIADHPGMIDHVYVTNTLNDDTPWPVVSSADHS